MSSSSDDDRAQALFQLASQLKRGEITKKEMMSRIQKLSRKKHTTTSSSTTSSAAAATPPPKTNRTAAVEQLLARHHPTSTDPDPGTTSLYQRAHSQTLTHPSDHTTTPSSIPRASHSAYATPLAEMDEVVYAGRDAHDVTAYVQAVHGRVSHAVGPAGEALPSPPANTVPREYNFELADRAPTALRAERVREEIKAREDAELTFKPKINNRKKKNKTKTTKPIDEPFLQREAEWQSRKVEHIQAERAAKAAHELDGCSFAPKINQRSHAMVRRGNGQEMTARMEASARKKAAREKKIREAQEARIASQCTFKPRISKKAAAAKPRYARPTTPASQQPTSGPTSGPASGPTSFHPKINDLPPTFTSAKLYLDKPAHLRLAEARSLTSNNRGTSNRTTPTPTGHDAENANPPVQRQRSTRGGGGGGESGAAPDSRMFDDFWRRQQETVARRAKSVAAQLKEEEAVYSYQPVITETASKLVAKAGSTSFINRYYHSARKRELSRSMAMYHDPAAANPDCTFQPKISRKAKSRKPRTADEMSRGDLLKRVTERKVAAAAVSQEVDDELTFAPALNTRRNRKVQSTLRLNEDPDSYVERVKMAEKRREALKIAQQVHQAEHELDGCTFRPRIHDAPDYVKRIAKSRRMTKSMIRDQVSRPAWQ